ncbi:MAG: hypothetical protein FWC75_09480 [Oscillospiraceae bacterium]|nr:hypothetical protein [Oscillospiraceae bacterium]
MPNLTSDLFSEVESATGYLLEGIGALQRLHDDMSSEGYQSDTQSIDETRAIVFASRFPRCLATLHVIIRDLRTNINAIDESLGIAYKQKEADSDEL